MKQDKINKLMENLIMTPDQNKLKDLISRKNFTINLSSNNIAEENTNIDEENSLILEYLLSKKTLDKSDQVFIDNFTG